MAPQAGERAVTASAWAMLVVCWSVVTYFTVRTFVQVLRCGTGEEEEER